MLRLWGNSRAEVGAHGTGHRAAGDEPPHGAMVAAPRKGDSLGWMSQSDNNARGREWWAPIE